MPSEQRTLMKAEGIVFAIAAVVVVVASVLSRIG